MNAIPRPGGPTAALAIATGFGLGYLPVAPGTWGSLGGVALFLGLQGLVPRLGSLLAPGSTWSPGTAHFLAVLLAANLTVAALGLWAAYRAAQHFRLSDPGPVVIDEISGQLITLIAVSPGSWTHLLAGFFLFRAFDIWKPFPARQAEAWPGGWGIMADDWIAGGYAAVMLCLLRWWGW